METFEFKDLIQWFPKWRYLPENGKWTFEIDIFCGKNSKTDNSIFWQKFTLMAILIWPNYTAVGFIEI